MTNENEKPKNEDISEDVSFAEEGFDVMTPSVTVDGTDDADLDKEIEELSTYLDDNDDFSLDDEIDELTLQALEKEEKSGVMKFVAMIVVFLVLAVGGYFGWKMTQSSSPSQGESFDIAETNTPMDDMTGATDDFSSLSETTEELNEIYNDQLSSFDSDTNTDLPVAVDSVSETIADSLEQLDAPIVQEGNEEAMTDEVPSDEGLEIVSDETIDTDDVFNLDDAELANRPESADEDMLLDSDVVDVADDAEEILEDTIDVLESEASETGDIAAEPETVMDEVEEVVAVESLKAEPIEENVPQAPKPEPAVAKTPKVESKAEPQIGQNDPVIVKDARVDQARNFYDQGQYQMAMTLYQAVLNDNPADTSALTGIQLAKAKLRMETLSATPQTPSVQPVAPTVTEPVAMPTMQESVAVISPVNALAEAIKQSQDNPRDAHAMLKLADAYSDAGQNMQAIEAYKKALQLDVVYSAGLNRMAIYDSIAKLQ